MVILPSSSDNSPLLDITTQLITAALVVSWPRKKLLNQLDQSTQRRPTTNVSPTMLILETIESKNIAILSETTTKLATKTLESTANRNVVSPMRPSSSLFQENLHKDSRKPSRPEMDW